MKKVVKKIQKKVRKNTVKKKDKLRASINEIDDMLLQAAFGGDLNAVKECVKKGADVNARDEFGRSALTEAAKQGHLQVVKYLVNVGADIENGYERPQDITPLMTAAYGGKIDVVRFLLSKGAKVRDDLLMDIWTKVKILKENVEIGMVNPQAALAWENFLHFLQLWQFKQLEPRITRCSTINAQLLMSVFRGDVNGVKKAIKLGADVNTCDDQGISALRWASHKGRAEIVEVLLDAGANVNQCSETGWTALMEAVIAGSIETVSLLSDRGADINAKTSANVSALDLAYEIIKMQVFADQKSATEIVKILENHGAKCAKCNESTDG